jgi:hypothetical protein
MRANANKVGMGKEDQECSVCVRVCVFQTETAVPLAQTQTGGETGAKTYNLASKFRI